MKNARIRIEGRGDIIRGTKGASSACYVAERFQSILQLLCPPSATHWMPDRMYQIFMIISKEWSTNSWKGKYPFISGICSNRSPIEMSISVSKNQNSLLRFLTQTHDPSGSTRDNLCLAKSRSLSLAKILSNATSVHILDELFEDYPGLEGEIPKGDFFIWIGCEALASQSLNLKLYINPWSSKDHPGLPAIFRAFKVCSIGSECLDSLTRVIRIIGKSFPQIIGIDLDKHGLICLKIYVVSHHMTRAKFEKLFEAFGTLKQYESWGLIDSALELRASDFDNREVHIGVRFTPNHPSPMIKANLFCQHFFLSDYHVIDIINKMISKFNFSSSRVGQLVHTIGSGGLNENEVDLFSFIGIAQSKIDVYFRPW